MHFKHVAQMRGGLAQLQNLTGPQAQPWPNRWPKFDTGAFDRKPEPRPKFDSLSPSDLVHSWQ